MLNFIGYGVSLAKASYACFSILVLIKSPLS